MKVKSKADFKRHITLHRKRLMALALALYPNAPLTFKLLVWLHDVEKYLVLDELYSFYAGGGDVVDRDLFVGRMNALGKKLVAPLYFLLDPVTLARYTNLERIADVVDRHSDPVALEEFNLPRRLPMSKFLRRDQLVVAGPLLKRYKEITKGLEY